MPAPSSTPLTRQRPAVLLWTLLLFLFLAVSTKALDIPAPVGHVNDFAGMISAQTRAALEQRLVDLQRVTDVEVAVATIKSLDGDTVENVAVELFKQWGIGKKGKDNGVLVLIAKDDRKSRIEVGYGLEGVLTDVGTSRIQREILVPAFQRGEFDAGVAATVDAIEKAVRGDAAINTPDAASRPQQRSSLPLSLIKVIFYLVVFLFSWLASVLGRSKSWWTGGIGGGVLGFIIGVIFFSLATAAVSAVVSGILGAFFDFVVSRHYEQSKGRGVAPRWWGGGPWIGGGGWGGGSSGGGFGGFGGGSSGGSGSSASW